MTSSKNHIPIGIIGSQTFVQQILKIISTFPSFSPLTAILHSEEDVPNMAEEMAGRVEVLLLSSPHMHRKVKEALNAAIPVHHVPVTDASLSNAFFRANRSGNLTAGVSIDTLTESMVARTLRGLGIPGLNFMTYNGPAYASNQELVEFHKRAYLAGESSVAFTAVEAAAELLTRLGIPNEWLLPSDHDIIVTLERALLSTETRRSKESQIVVGIIQVDHLGNMIMNAGSEHEVQKLRLDIHRTILDYVESLDGYLTHLGGDEYLFFTTRGIFERETGGYKTIPLAKDAGKKFGITFSIGIGFGTSANEAGTHARISLRKAKEAGGSTCFIVREDKTIIGPLETVEPVHSVLSLSDAELIRTAEDSGMSSAYLSRLSTNFARTGKLEYKVHELASLLGITTRSAHRLLQAWIDNGLVEISGMEKVPKGRPRQIFRFTLLE